MQASRILIIFLYVATASLSALALTSCDFVGLKTEGGTDDVVGRMKAPLDTYHNHTGAYPSTGDGLHALLEVVSKV